MLILFVFVINGQSQELPWGDNFNDGNMDGWTVIDDEPYRSGPSTWKVSSGGLYQTTNIRTTENELAVYKGTHAITGNPDWSDYYFATRIYTSDDEGLGMLFRYQDEDNYYRFITLKNTDNWGKPFKRLEKQINGRFTTLAQSTNDIKIPGSFVGKIKVVGDSIFVFEDGALLFAVKDDTFKKGKIGLMCYANRGAIFDDVYVGEQDTTFEKVADPTNPAILTAASDLTIKVLTLNIWVNGKICTPSQIADLIESLDVDFAGLQECNSSFGNEVAALTGMHLASGYDCYLLSKTPYTKVNTMFINGINAWTNINGQTVSIYNFHIRWDEEGDRQARTMVSTFKIDPVPIQIAIGDFNDEHYSTQITIIEEHMRYCLADLGWAPSQRVTWPAFGFYGGEGAQTIDLVFCNKISKGRVIEGEILNTSPLLSDHKPVWATIEFPADKEMIGPKLVSVTPYLGSDIIELWFDQDLDRESAKSEGNYQISALDGGAGVTVTEAALTKDPRRVRLTTSAHDYDKKYQISVNGLTDEFAVPVGIESTKEYTVRQNLLKNASGESGVDNWEIFGGFANVADRENQLPYTGNYFFTGGNLQDLSSGKQAIDLSEWTDDIDAGLFAAEWNCFFATGYEVLGTIKASRCEPYDEGEMYIEFIDENEMVLMQASSKRWDTLYWHPYGETTFIPSGTRKAHVYLNSYRKTKNGLSNDAAFENAYFSVKKLQQLHSYGPNLLANFSAETGDLTGWDVDGPLRARAHEDNKGRPVSGYYMFSNAGISSGHASQTFDVSHLVEKIDTGEMAVKWGGYMRDYIGDSSTEIKVEFYDSDKNEILSATTGMEKIAEWTLYDSETSVPPKTKSVKFVFLWNAVDEEGAYFDFLHLLLVDKNLTSVAQNKSPDEFRLDQNYPNPFNPSTNIVYNLSLPGMVKLTVYNTLGQEIAKLVDVYQTPGPYKILWDGIDNAGNSVPSGLYFYKLLTSQQILTKKMMLLR